MSIRGGLTPTYQPLLATNQSGMPTTTALQVKIDKRFAKGLSILGAYTWSKSHNGHASRRNGRVRARPAGLAAIAEAYRGLWSADNPSRRMTISTLYELPFGRGRHFLNSVDGISDKVVSGWQVGAIATLASWPTTDRHIAI